MTCNLHRKGGPVGGVSAASMMVKSVSFEEKNRDISLLGFVFSFSFSPFSSMEFSIIYHGRSR